MKYKISKKKIIILIIVYDEKSFLANIFRLISH